jgi:hypothetical protein
MYLNLNGYSYYIDRLENELDRSYHLRCWYIANQNPKNMTEYKDAMKLGKLFVNYKLLNCKYHETVQGMFLKNVPVCF